MRRLFSVSRSGTEHVEAAWYGPARAELLLLPREAYEVHVMEVPPVDDRELDSAIPQRLRAVYPGSLETTAVDHRRNGNDPSSRIVFAAPREVLAGYRRLGPSRKLTAFSLVLSQTARKGIWSAVHWDEGYCERCVFQGSSLASSERFERSKEMEADFVRIVANAAADGTPIVVVVSAAAAGETEKLRALAAASFGDIRVQTIADVLKRLDPAAAEIFSARGLRRRPRGPVVVRLLAALDLVLVTFAFNRYADMRELQLAALKTRYAAVRTENGERAEKAAELSRWEERLSALKAGRGPDSYAFTADLAATLGGGSLIRSLTIQGDEFTVEAEGRDALGSLYRLERSPRFKEVHLHQSIPLAGERGERFSISGRYADDRP